MSVTHSAPPSTTPTLTPIRTRYTTRAMMIDNTPGVALDVISPGVGKCGGLALGTDRKITFAVTAHDPAGQVARYWLCYGTRGKTAVTAGLWWKLDWPRHCGPDPIRPAGVRCGCAAVRLGRLRANRL